MKKFTRGFTLIELLVVIAIIGVLASIVLVSLNGARKKGADARIISDVQETRTALETGFNGSAYPDLKTDATNTNGNVNATCITNGWNNQGPDTANINTLIGDACAQSGNTNAIVINTQAAASPTTYAIYGRLAENGLTAFCIDSAGGSNAAETNLASSNCR